MDRIGRLLVVFVALGCGVASAIIALPILSLTDPTTREAGFVLFATSILSSIMVSSDPQEAAGTLVLLLRSVTLLIVILPLAVACLVGELVRTRSWLWYACCSGLLAAAMPWIVRLGMARHPGQASAAAGNAEARFFLLFFLTGVIAGTVYWLIAGRNAGRDQAEPTGV